MTALTPQQMRELADDFYPELAAEPPRWLLLSRVQWRASDALRTAADQLEAARAWVNEHYHHFPEISELDAILTTDTAPQEDRDDWPCGHVGHDASFWEDEEAGVLWCPDCGTEYHLGKAGVL